PTLHPAEAPDDPYTELEPLESSSPDIHKHPPPPAPPPATPTNLEFSLELPVHPANPVTVLFPAASDPANPLTTQDATTSAATAATAQAGDGPVDSHELVHLPAVLLRIALPPGYPAEQPPAVAITTTPPWLTPETVEKLERDGPRMWADAGRNLVAFDYIDHVQQAADAVFHMIDAAGTLRIDPSHKLAILDYDIQARRAAFARETFDCGVCLEPKKGAVCHQMLDCRHVFCAACLLDFYATAITEGDLATVRCLAPSCAKDRAAAADRPAGGPAAAAPTAAVKKKKKVKTFISPSELLQMGLSQELVTRYVTLMYKTELESDKNTIYCPRSWCEGAARSKKHKKPSGLELGEASDDSDDADADADAEAEGGATTKQKKRKKKKKAAYDPADLLSICEECGFAFCSRCCQSWHGEFVSCMPPRDTGELSAEEQASIDYLKLHSTPCPTCAAPAQKTHGCNHMICFRCNSHFCYLCSAWLDPANPYQHFNEQPGGKRTSCYMRLWELEEGDGDDVGYGFAGGAGGDQAAVQPPPAVLPDDVDVPPVLDDDPAGHDESDSDSDDGREANDQAPRDNVPGAVAREGPLVLRIGGDPQPRIAVPPPAPQAPPPPPPPGRGRGGHHGANHARGGRGNGHGPGRGNNRGAGVRAGPRPNGAQERAGGNMPRRIPVRHGDGADEMNPQDAAWVRNFVQMALADVEDDSDGEADDLVLFAMAQ
ncbi:hypothetical protein VD0002_g9593, partial [Verticillium dahliae]